MHSAQEQPTPRQAPPDDWDGLESELREIIACRVAAAALNADVRVADVARLLDVPDRTVRSLARRGNDPLARQDDEVREIVLRYALGDLTQQQMREQLTGHDHPAAEAMSSGPMSPATWDQIRIAAREGLIDDDDYEYLRAARVGTPNP